MCNLIQKLPPSTNQQPTSNQQQPTIIQPEFQPQPASNQPATNHNQPATNQHQPATNQQPTSNQPQPTNNQPATNKQPTSNQPATNQQPTTTNHNQLSKSTHVDCQVNAQMSKSTIARGRDMQRCTRAISETHMHRCHIRSVSNVSYTTCHTTQTVEVCNHWFQHGSLRLVRCASAGASRTSMLPTTAGATISHIRVCVYVCVYIYIYIYIYMYIHICMPLIPKWPCLLRGQPTRHHS